MRDEHCLTIRFDIDLEDTLEKAEALIKTGESVGWTEDVEEVVTQQIADLIADSIQIV